MRSVGCVLLTAISAMSPTLRPERLAADVMRSFTAEMFAAIDMRRRSRPGAPAPHNHYIIAVGGAGSLGSPAAETGTKIIKAAKPTNTIIPPTRYDGSLKICGGWLGAPHDGTNCNPAQTRPSKASPAISPEATSTPAFSTRAFCALLNPRRLATQSPNERKTPPTKIANVVPKGKYMPTATS